jgi:hypothetical protein
LERLIPLDFLFLRRQTPVPLLSENPEQGKIIKEGGGIRKLRYALSGRGKSSGVRVISYWNELPRRK